MSLTKLAAICCCMAMVRRWVAADAAESERVTVDTPLGTLKGLRTTTILRGKTMYSFRGIPYAKPNVGRDKFRTPEPADPWDGVLDATENGATCIFYGKLFTGERGDEDCLFLNVYTPELNKEAKKAVMFWIHGGAFISGSGSDEFYGPDFLLEKDVILVTINYRLGPLGFLNTGDAGAPGNAGFKDQVLALKWVRDNIANFGGSPDRVTIFGQSAGSASVQYHLLSPMSRGLFQAAIQQSGSTPASWAYSYNPKEAAFMLGARLGVITTDTATLVNRLAEFPAAVLVNASSDVSKLGNPLNGNMNKFGPASEADVGQEIFLPADPWEMIKHREIADVPIMNGMTVDDAGIFTELGINFADLIGNNFFLFVPNDLNVTNPLRRLQLGESLKNFYCHGKPLNHRSSEELTRLFTDVFFTYGTSMTSAIINSRISSPVYDYLFAFEAPFGFLKALFGTQKGCVHGDDLTYLFYSNFFKNKPEPGSDVEKMIDIMTDLWTNFAKELNPTPNTDGAVKVNWEPKGQENNYLEISLSPVMRRSMMKERVSFWTHIYKDILGDYSTLIA